MTLESDFILPDPYQVKGSSSSQGSSEQAGDRSSGERPTEEQALTDLGREEERRMSPPQENDFRKTTQ